MRLQKERSYVGPFMLAALAVMAVGSAALAQHAIELSDDQVENIVRRSYQYVAMYNVNNKFALKQGGWNTVVADTALKDHTMKEIARPNNDTLYISCMLDLRKDPVILEMPAFDSKYVSLMITAYDHYVNVPMTTRLGDFKKPEKMLLYSARTEGYNGEKVKGVDRYFEATGDFVSAVFRVMPHANDPGRYERIVEQMQSVKLVTLSEYRGGEAKPIDDIEFPPVGKTDADIFENNFLEVMQFVVNHTTFDPGNQLDQALLAALKPLGIEVGKQFDGNNVAGIDGKRFRKIVERVQKSEFARSQDPAFTKEHGMGLFQPKGQMPLQLLLLQSIIGPIGLPAAEAMYVPVVTKDGQPMNARNDYVIRMAKDELPPAGAFWSLTLYDMKNGFFIPNDRKKYSVGENGGMKLSENGGIEIYVDAEKPEGVPDVNWLPINRKDEDMDIVLRVYAPDLERMKTWTPPKAETVKPKAGKETPMMTGKVEILQSWHGDFPVDQLERLPKKQRELRVGYIGDAKAFGNVWKAFKPGEDEPEIDFDANLVLFARNAQFYNRIRIGQVNLKAGVAEVLAMETLSAAPIEDKVAMSLAVVPRQGISGIQSGDAIIPVEDNR